MAGKKEKKEKAPKGAKGGKKKGLPLLALIPLAIAGVAALPVTLVMVAGLIPSIVIAFTDRNPKRNLTVAVVALNIASTLYVVLLLLKQGFSIDYAIRLLSQPVHFAIMWGGAGIGLALMSFVPQAVAQVLSSVAEIKIQKYRDNQNEMKKTWGDQVGQ
jgi:hypothetical protein